MLSEFFKKIPASLVDPGFGQLGGSEILSEILPMKPANIGQGPGPALGPGKFLHFYCQICILPLFF